MRIFGLPEDTGGASVAEYLGKLLKKELQLPDGTNLQIQCAHRALTRKVNPGGTLRSIVVNFLQFETKEMVLQKGWENKGIQVGDKKNEILLS